MKLLRCDVDRFGVLSGYSLVFSEGLTVVREANGFGKTTLAAFIRVMFYGMPRTNKKDLKKDYRRRFAPWQGGTYGGSLTFETEGRQYRITRTFGASKQQDTFSLIDLETKSESLRFSENTGEELFALDAESFERSTCMSQLDGGTSFNTDSIHAKLGGLVEDTDDVNNYDSAVKTLQKRRSQLQAYRGSGGSIGEEQARVRALEEELVRGEEWKAALTEALEKREALEEELAGKREALKTVRERIVRASEAEAAAARAAGLERLRREEAGLRRRKSELDETYPKGLPPQDEMQEIEGVVRDLDALDRQREPEGLERDRALVEACREKYRAGLPESETLDRFGEMERTHASLRLSLAQTVLSQGDAAELEELERFFAPGVPDGETLEAQWEALRRVEALRLENSRFALPVPVPDREEGRKKGGRWSIVLLLLGTAALAAGGLLLAGRYLLFGALALAIGAPALIAGLFFTLKSALKRELAAQTDAAGAREARIQRERNETALRRMEEELDDFTARYFSDGRSPEDALAELRAKRDGYLSLKRREEECRRKRAALREEAERLERQLTDFLRPYCGEPVGPDRYGACLRALERECLAYRHAEEALSQAREEEARRARERDSLRARMAAFFDAYALSPAPPYRDALQKLRDAGSEYARLEDALAENRAQLDRFLARYGEAAEEGPSVPPEPRGLDELKETERALLERMDAVSREETELGRRTGEARERVDALPARQDELERCRQKLESDKRDRDTLDRTIDLLREAKEALSESYTGPLHAAFTRYAGRLLGEEEAGAVTLSPTLEVRLEEYGVVRELEYFSAGYTDMLMLCMRLALLKALFQKETPLLILDDPFANLDDRHTERALSLLRDLAGEQQILYLVCNSSRC